MDQCSVIYRRGTIPNIFYQPLFTHNYLSQRGADFTVSYHTIPTSSHITESERVFFPRSAPKERAEINIYCSSCHVTSSFARGKASFLETCMFRIFFATPPLRIVLRREASMHKVNDNPSSSQMEYAQPQPLHLSFHLARKRESMMISVPIQETHTRAHAAHRPELPNASFSSSSQSSGHSVPVPTYILSDLALSAYRYLCIT